MGVWLSRRAMLTVPRLAHRRLRAAIERSRPGDVQPLGPFVYQQILGPLARIGFGLVGVAANDVHHEYDVTAELFDNAFLACQRLEPLCILGRVFVWDQRLYVENLPAKMPEKVVGVAPSGTHPPRIVTHRLLKEF
jgi:hypothetical protein